MIIITTTEETVTIPGLLGKPDKEQQLYRYFLDGVEVDIPRNNRKHRGVKMSFLVLRKWSGEVVGCHSCHTTLAEAKDAADQDEQLDVAEVI